MIRLLFILFPLVGFAQDHRWSFTVEIDGDTMVVAPITDLRLALAYRLTVDSSNAVFRAERIERVNTVVSLNTALEASKKAHGECSFREAAVSRELATTTADLGSALLDLGRLKPWATVGKVGTFVVVVGTVIVVVYLVKETLTP